MRRTPRESDPYRDWTVSEPEAASRENGEAAWALLRSDTRSLEAALPECWQPGSHPAEGLPRGHGWRPRLHSASRPVEGEDSSLLWPPREAPGQPKTDPQFEWAIFRTRARRYGEMQRTTRRVVRHPRHQKMGCRRR